MTSKRTPRNGTPSRSREKAVPAVAEVTKLDIDQLSQLVETQLKIGDTKSALFWAEKRMAIQSFNNSGNPSMIQIAEYLKILKSAGDWKTLCTYIITRDLHIRHLLFSYFYISAMHELSKFEEIVTIPLGHLRQWESVPLIIPDTVAQVFAEKNTKITGEEFAKLDNMLLEQQLESRLLYLLADTYLALQNRTAASACIQFSIKMNPLSSEAVMFALKSHLLPVKSIRETLVGAKIKPDEKPLIDVIYLLLDYHSKEIHETEPKYKILEQSLSSDLSIQTAKALRLYSTGHITEAFEITDQTIIKYGFQEGCLLIHIGCLVEMEKMVQLYELAHKLIEMEPEQELTFYAIGCYYYIAEQYTAARKFFHKCVNINPNFGHGWLAHGHALSFDKEHEQAMNCYLRASRLLENFAEPILYTGIEYCHANNLKQAAEHIKDAADFSKTPNAVILHELATVYLYDRDYERAIETYFKALMALTRIETDNPHRDIELLFEPILDEYWVPLYYNLGFAMLKSARPCTAITCYRKVLQTGYQKAAAWAQIGYCYCSALKPRLAISAFMNSLALNPNNSTVKSAYDRAIAIVSIVPDTTIAKEPLTFMECVDIENFPPPVKAIKNELSDDRPNLGRFMLESHHLSKLSAEQVFNQHRNPSKHPMAKIKTEIKQEPSTMVSEWARRISGGGESPSMGMMMEDEDGQVSDPSRPATAPATIPFTEQADWILRGSALIEESSADIDAFEGGSRPRVRNRETASAEAVMIGRSEGLESTGDEADLTISSDTMNGEDLTSSFARSSIHSFNPLLEVQDPQELFTSWFMDDIHNDTVRRAYDEVSTLRPPPMPRRRDLTGPDYPRGDMHGYFRGSVLRNARIRRGGRPRS